MILTFFLSPIGRKIGLAALALGAFFYITRLMTNHAYEQGRADGTRTTLVEQEAKHKAEWATAEKALLEQQKALAFQNNTIKTDRQKAAKSAAALTNDFNTKLTQLEQQRRDREKQNDSITDIDLVPKLRELLDSLRPEQPCTVYKPCPGGKSPEVGFTGTPGSI